MTLRSGSEVSKDCPNEVILLPVYGSRWELLTAVPAIESTYCSPPPCDRDGHLSLRNWKPKVNRKRKCWEDCRISTRKHNC
ncbi:hypothetical protein STEG23_003381 [Scotinomys teguina]